MLGVPPVLPPGLYEAASRRGSARSPSSFQPGFEVPPIPSIPKQFTGPQRVQSPINRQFGSPLSAQSTGSDWLVSPQEKAHFDNIFATVDTAKSGIISGDQAVAFFMKAQLPDEILAQIWDLADIDADGQLTKDEFAVAMHLVRQVRAGRELPQTVPPALIPPSMRRRPPVNAAPVPAPMPVPVSTPSPAPRSAAEDLFGLDTIAAPPKPAPAQVAQSTGGSNPPLPVPGSPASRTSPTSPTTTFKPFIPASSFGQSLQPQLTGQVPPTARPQPPPSEEDLLGDNDPEESKKLTQETTDLANLSNQVGSLAKEMHNVQGKRASAEEDLSQNSQQKRDFEARLSQARAMYEQEVKSFKALEERLKASKAETTKLQQEYALIDGSRQDLQNQYNQVSTALTADQQENASLKEKIRRVNSELAQLKPALEKARSEGRQQKGLAAINKKQLATVEGERDKVQGELDTTTREDAESQETAAPAVVASPAASTASQNTNPFFRRTTTAGSNEYALSPAVSNEQQSAFDNLFGPAFGSPTSVTPPPPTSFRSESPQQTRSKSPMTPGVPTPSVSPPPNAGSFSGPPSVPQSRQITPSVLPLGETQTGTTSTMVSPPESRVGAPETSTAEGPTQEAGSGAARGLGEPIQRSASAESPVAEKQKVEVPPEIPGAFPGEPNSAISGTTNEKQDQSKDPSFDELFGDRPHERSQSQRDFDEAFASLKHGGGNAKANEKGHATTTDSEFPPIHEIDDDDDSTDSEAPMGFDDNFAPGSPPRTQEPKHEPIDPAQLAAFPAPGALSPRSPPSANAQESPPKYEGSTSNENGGFPREFNGLLPKRTDPTAPPDAPHSLESSTGAPVVGGEAQKGTSGEAPPPADAKRTPAPDFEAAFAGLDLAPAKETEDDDDDSDPGAQEKSATDFDFSFDSTSQPKAAAPPAAPPASTFPGQATSSDFDNFNNTLNAPSAPDHSAKPAISGVANTQPATEHDWDAIFAPLDQSQSLGTGSNGAGAGSKPGQPSPRDERAPGWALAADGEDDLILQRLTGMGFPRDASLDALERFDYNIDKVSPCWYSYFTFLVLLTTRMFLGCGSLDFEILTLTWFNIHIALLRTTSSYTYSFHLLYPFPFLFLLIVSCLLYIPFVLTSPVGIPSFASISFQIRCIFSSILTYKNMSSYLAATFAILDPDPLPAGIIEKSMVTAG